MVCFSEVVYPLEASYAHWPSDENTVSDQDIIYDVVYAVHLLLEIWAYVQSIKCGFNILISGKNF